MTICYYALKLRNRTNAVLLYVSWTAGVENDELSIQKELESEQKTLVHRTIWYAALYQAANQNYPIWYVG